MHRWGQHGLARRRAAVVGHHHTPGESGGTHVPPHSHTQGDESDAGSHRPDNFPPVQVLNFSFVSYVQCVLCFEHFF
jgi:hypothetical protein